MDQNQFESVVEELKIIRANLRGIASEIGASLYVVGFFMALGMDWASREWSSIFEIAPVVLWSLLSWIRVGGLLVSV